MTEIKYPGEEITNVNTNVNDKSTRITYYELLAEQRERRETYHYLHEQIPLFPT